MTVLDIQRRLQALGFDPGPLDGAWGSRTRAAVIAFQKARGLTVDGVVGPKTTAAMYAGTRTYTGATEPIWVQDLRRRMGLHESNPALKAYLKSDGRTLGDPELLPWCGDAVETPIRLTLPDEPIPTNPYLARNWLTFGIRCPEPVVGAVAVFSRPPSPTSGHVGFVVGADATHLSILGGNQSNTVSVSRIAKNRLLGCRWPKTAGEIVVTAMPKATGAITTNEA